MIAGIQRIHIISDWVEPRLEFAHDLESTADEVYRGIFERRDTPLLPGLDIIKCTKQEAMARYDWREGVDLIFNLSDGTRMTCQEKILDFSQSTLTVTEHQMTKPGAWYTCTAQLYFVGYARNYRNFGDKSFQDWIMVNFPALKLKKDINWQFKENTKNGYIGIAFRFIPFSEVPDDCIIDCYDYEEVSF